MGWKKEKKKKNLFFCDQKCSLYPTKGMAFLDLLSKNTNWTWALEIFYFDKPWIWAFDNLLGVGMRNMGIVDKKKKMQAELYRGGPLYPSWTLSKSCLFPRYFDIRIWEWIWINRNSPNLYASPFFELFSLCERIRKKTTVTTLSFLFLSLSVLAGPVHLPDIWGVQHRGKSALCLKAVGVNERNDKFLMGSLLKSQAGGGCEGNERIRVCGGMGRSGAERRGHRFHASVPLPFMLGLTYMHLSPTIKHWHAALLSHSFLTHIG